MIIAIDGIDGSGKSVFTAALRARFERGLLLSIDDFRRPVTWGGDARSEADLYYDEYYDLEALERCLQAMASGVAQVEIPNWDPVTERIDGTRTLALAGSDMAIVEGVFARRIPTVGANAIVVYLHTSFGEARRRILRRDTAKGRTVTEVTRRIDERYFPSQRRYIAEFEPADRADILIDNEDPASPVLLHASNRVSQELLATLL